MVGMTARSATDGSISMKSSRARGVADGTALVATGPGVRAASPASQHDRISPPSSAWRRRSRPQKPRFAATARRKFRQVPQAVEERRQTQHRAVSAWGVPQCGHRHIGMAAMVAASAPRVERTGAGYFVMVMGVRSEARPNSSVCTQIVA